MAMKKRNKPAARKRKIKDVGGDRDYGWGGWKAPILNWGDADYCEYGCPICTRARRGHRLALLLQAIEMLVTFGGCPWGRARRRKYGVKPNEPLTPGTERRRSKSGR